MRPYPAIVLLLALAAAAPAAAGQLDGPENIVITPGGTLYVANHYGNDILIYMGGKVVGTISTGAHQPFRLALDTALNLYVGLYDVQNVLEYSPAGEQLRKVPNASGFGLSVDAYDDLITTPTHGGGASIYDEDGLFVANLTADKQGIPLGGGSAAILGQYLYLASNQMTIYNVGNFLAQDANEVATFPTSTTSGPTQMAFDSAGNIYVVGFSNNMVKYSPTGQVLLTISKLRLPTGVALDRYGNIYVSENEANDIRVFSAAGKLITVLKF